MANIKIYDSHHPALEPGIYQIAVSQELKVAGNTLIIDSHPIDFIVEAEKYAIDQQQIDSLFPPAGSMGDFSLVLPHIILNRSILPWERQVKNPDKNTPWLALLLFTEDEIGEVAKPNALAPPAYDAKKCYNLHIKKTDFEQSKLPTTPTEFISDSKEELISVIVCDKNFLTGNILPKYEELPYLSHVRSGDSEKAVIVCNRLPKIDRKNILHLVSFEECYDANGIFTGKAAANSMVALVSLKSWEFYCNDHFIITPEVLDKYKDSTAIDAAVPPNPLVTALLTDALFKISGKEYFDASKLADDLGDPYKSIYNKSKTLLTDAEKVNLIRIEYLLKTFRIGHLPDILKHLNRSPSTLRLQHSNYADSNHYVINADLIKNYLQVKEKITGALTILTNTLSQSAQSKLSTLEFFSDDEFLNIFKDPSFANYSNAFNKKKAKLPLTTDESSNALKIDYLLNNFRESELGTFLLNGYLNFPYTLKTGKVIEAFYRGPLIPGDAVNVAIPITLRHADEALRYINSINKLDVSYASAWELGKLLAIQNKNFSVALYKWKRACYQTFKIANRKDKTSTEINYPEPPQLVIDWFNNIKDLKGIPFNYWVPDPSLIPFESIRFFSVDELWLSHLIDGAFSIGRISTLEVDTDHELYAYQKKQNENIKATTPDEIKAKEKYNFLLPLYDKRSGFLLHSVAVAGWPDLVIHKGEKPVDPETIESPEYEPYLKNKLSQNLLLCLFKGNTGCVSIHQKPESIHFGFEDDEQAQKYTGIAELYNRLNQLAISTALPDVSQVSNQGVVSKFANSLVQQIEVITFNAKTT